MTAGAVAFLFPGQGSQRPGMGRELLDAPGGHRLRESLAAAGSFGGRSLEEICLQGPAEELMRTEIAQPAIFGVSLAMGLAARERGLTPALVAGHSLGEYTAAVFAGALPAAAGARLVAERGRLMAEAQGRRPGAMASVMGLAPEAAAQVVAEAGAAGTVVAANFNSPSQTVYSGDEAAVERLVALAREAGADDARRLQVGAAFHSPLMEPVRERLAEVADGLPWRDAEVPVLSCATAAAHTAAAEVRAALIAQVTSPVRWVECTRALLRAASVLLELGPGRTLTGLARQVDPDAVAFAADAPARLEQMIAANPPLAACVRG